MTGGGVWFRASEVVARDDGQW